MQSSIKLNAKKIGPRCPKTFITYFKQARLSTSGVGKILLAAFLSAGLLSSCVTISPATVELSSKVGDGINEMEQMHQLAVQHIWDSEEKKIEDFMTKEWEPLFLKNFLFESGVMDELNSASRIEGKTRELILEALKYYITDTTEVPDVAKELFRSLDKSRSLEAIQIRAVLDKYVEDNELEKAVLHVNTLLGTDDAAKIILDFAEAAHERMQAQRDTLLAPIRQARADETAAISAAYAELIRGQSIITGRLEAARKKSEVQASLLNSVRSTTLYQNFTERALKLSTAVDSQITAARKKLISLSTN
jgi:hypothetical protein